MGLSIDKLAEESNRVYNHTPQFATEDVDANGTPVPHAKPLLHRDKPVVILAGDAEYEITGIDFDADREEVVIVTEKRA